MRARLELVSPRERSLRHGAQVELAVDVALPEPWFEPPRLGRKVSGLGGVRHRGLDFETGGSERPVQAVTEGRARVQDTRVDCHASGQGNGRAAGGYQVLVRAGALTLSYGHLKRGSGQSGTVRVGQRIGLSGNSGRCPGGEQRRFVSFRVKRGGAELAPDGCRAPFEVVARAGGRAIGAPVPVPPGVLEVKRLKLGRWTARRREPLVVELRRAGRVLAQESCEVTG